MAERTSCPMTASPPPKASPEADERVSDFEYDEDEDEERAFYKEANRVDSAVPWEKLSYARRKYQAYFEDYEMMHGIIDERDQPVHTHGPRKRENDTGVGKDATGDIKRQDRKVDDNALKDNAQGTHEDRDNEAEEIAPAACTTHGIRPATMTQSFVPNEVDRHHWVFKYILHTKTKCAFPTIDHNFVDEDGTVLGHWTDDGKLLEEKDGHCALVCRVAPECSN